MIDWQKVILNLRASGLSASATARRVKADAATVQRLARGEIKEPRFSQGLALLDLHLALCPEKHKEVRIA